VLFAMAVGELQAQRDPTPAVTVDAFVSDVETASITVDQRPQRVPAETRQRLA